MQNIPQHHIYLAQTIWNYHKLDYPIAKSDIILVLGSHDLRVVDRAVELYRQGYAKRILFSGGIGRLTDNIDLFKGSTEAEVFKNRAVSLGVPIDHILIETKSTNTGENIIYSHDILKEFDIQNIIIVQKPYMERRVFATLLAQYPDKNTQFFVTSPKISFLQYPNSEIRLEEIISIMVGDLQRIIEYPFKGYQVHQDIPDDVLNAYEQLVSLGYSYHLI